MRERPSANPSAASRIGPTYPRHARGSASEPCDPRKTCPTCEPDVRPASTTRLPLTCAREPTTGMNPVVVNTGGGSPGDSTEILRTFLERRLEDALVLYVVDPEAAATAKHLRRCPSLPDPLHRLPRGVVHPDLAGGGDHGRGGQLRHGPPVQLARPADPVRMTPGSREMAEHGVPGAGTAPASAGRMSDAATPCWCSSRGGTTPAPPRSTWR